MAGSVASPDHNEWTFELLEHYERELGRIARGYELDTFPNQLEIISSEQMMDAYSSVGMPVGYHHWSFGKQFIATEQRYRRGQMGLAYEIVINSNPCIAYLMEENTLPMQGLVIAHAAYGHNSFFKGNYLFRTWTNADAIIDYLVFARNYIGQCEERHGELVAERSGGNTANHTDSAWPRGFTRTVPRCRARTATARSGFGFGFVPERDALELGTQQRMHPQQ